ncbi:hypothetical protein NSU_1478 [Novosphingobium pentaromativorans US6-1]|uniref:Uncharacterized protein n=1 Tax=Novosphingobium pentaromativorans US6-1 TaxID=1088721 RepID=G6EAT0_9SPHN|nr:hypothetical protein NSU_1478 [Novosphingobium pentaromativorans US6-1]
MFDLFLIALTTLRQTSRCDWHERDRQAGRERRLQLIAPAPRG